MKTSEFIKAVEHIVPVEWALPGDPVGLHLGDPSQELNTVLVGLEVTTPFLQKAIETNANFLLVHHPLIYRPLKQIVESNPVQRLLRELIRNNIGLYAAHSNADFHPEGMAKIWARKMGCKEIKPLAPKPLAGQMKIVTFVPEEHVNRVRDALACAGAGEIGEYVSCSFLLNGTGTFKGSEHSNPTVGEAGKLEFAPEVRLEMLLPAKRMNAVVNALVETHPYEEPAYDMHALEDVRTLQNALWLAEFDANLEWTEFEKRAAQSLPQDLVVFGGTRPNREQKVRRIAISTGSGGDFIPTVSHLSVDAFLTGEAKYHDLWEASERGLNVLTVGHDASESFFSEMMIGQLKKYVPQIRLIAG